ncbi:MAG: ATP-binding cassette domain-containing protein [Candidatus Brockarchaeota archaeon]|nr:ATP-binding cassette domain-containing protein [Candidatus Brockarchaeota archaeon]
MDAVQIIDVVKHYGNVLALDHVNLSVKEGEFFGLLGPNGAGKTTLIRILTGLTAPTSGRTLILGYDVLNEPVKAKKQFGLVPEISNVYDDLTAWDNLMFMAKLYGIPEREREERAMKLLEALGLRERVDSPVKQFSKGMRRRLAIAAALIHEPRILFLDEPTSGLDTQSSRFIREVLRELNRKGMTIFLTTHFIEEADQLCKRVAILDKGKICVVDTPENLKASLQEKEALEVIFNSPTSIDEEEFKKHCSGIVRLSENKFRFYVSDSSSILPLLVDFAKNKGLKILSVNTLKPILEDVFIKYTGIDPLMAERMEQLRYKR